MARTNTETGWVGWLYFAGTILLVVGGTQIIAGLVGIFNSDFYAVTSAGLVAFNFATWGWASLLIGVLAMLTGLGIWAGATWARVVGIFLAVLAMLDNFAFLNAYPLWALIGVALNGFIIYALTMHGHELAQ
jgi:hypothetical protein